MSTVDALFEAKDGAGLKVLAQDGDVAASVCFAELVFSNKYQGDTNVHKTKKAAKDEAREDAPALLETAAQTGDRRALELAADTYFSAVWEPGSFGSLIIPASYKKAKGYYEQLATLPDNTPEQQALYHYRLGRCYEFRNRIKSSKDPEHRQMVLDEYEAARQFPGTDSCVKATHCLSDIYWKEGDHKRGVELALEIVDKAPWAHLTVSTAYEKGLGIEADSEKAKFHKQAFYTLTASKGRKKK